MKLFLCLLISAFAVPAQIPTPATTLTGRWQVTDDFFGSPRYLGLTLNQKGNALTGEFTGDKLTGTTNGNTVTFTSKDTDGNTDAFTGTRENGTIHGTNKHLGDPRVETDDAIISMGLSGNLDDAFKEATGNMADWLTTDYQLTPSEVAQVIGASAEYHVS